MRAEVVSFRRGAGWIAEGGRLFRVAPLGWLALVVLYWMLMSLLGAVAAVGLPASAGVAAAAMLVPAFSVGFMTAARSAAQARMPRIAELFVAFRSGLPVQLALGATYAALLALVLGATALADGGALARWMVSGERPGESMLDSDEFRIALVIAAVGYAPVMMMFWFAPVLAAWHGAGAAKALFFSFVAVLINWRAFLGYGLAVALVAVLIPFGVMMAVLVASAGKARMFTAGVVLALLLVLLPVLYGSFFASYRDIFGRPSPSPEAGSAPQ